MSGASAVLFLLLLMSRFGKASLFGRGHAVAGQNFTSPKCGKKKCNLGLAVSK